MIALVGFIFICDGWQQIFMHPYAVFDGKPSLIECHGPRCESSRQHERREIDETNAIPYRHSTRSDAWAFTQNGNTKLVDLLFTIHRIRRKILFSARCIENMNDRMVLFDSSITLNSLICLTSTMKHRLSHHCWSHSPPPQLFFHGRSSLSLCLH